MNLRYTIFVLAMVVLGAVTDARATTCEDGPSMAGTSVMGHGIFRQKLDKTNNTLTRQEDEFDTIRMGSPGVRCAVESLEKRQLLSTATIGPIALATPTGPVYQVVGQPASVASSSQTTDDGQTQQATLVKTYAGGPVVITGPTTPASFSLTATALTPTSVGLTWASSVADNQTRFQILRQPVGSAGWVPIASVVGTERSYTDNHITSPGQYNYRIMMTNLIGGSVGYSNAIAVSTLIPAAPVTNLTAAVLTANSVQLTWSDTSPDIKYFQIQRQLGDTGQWTNVLNVPAATTQYTDTTAAAGTQYNYRVAAMNNIAPATDGAAVVPASTAPVLTPGTGFTGPTAQPAGTGAPGQLGFGENAIARWDVVPYQTFTGLFNVGVVAFDISGIKEVDFSVNGGPWTAVTQMTLNPQTANHTGVGNQNDGVVEYWATLNAANFQDGQIEVRAIAVPVVGVPRVLQGATIQDTGVESLNLYANTNGTFAGNTVYVSPIRGNDGTGTGTANQPYQSITKALSVASNGGTVILEDPGQYPVGTLAIRNANNNWITVMAAPGLEPAQVVITQPIRELVRPGVALLRWRGVSFDYNTITQYYPESGNFVWFDQCIWFNSTGWATVYSPDQMQPVRVSQYIGGSYVTNSTDQDQRWGFMDQTLVRGSLVHRISNDAFTNNKMTLNSGVDTIAVVIPGTHNDIFQYYVPAGGDSHISNIIGYNITAINLSNVQDFFLDHSPPVVFSDMAFVNISDQNVAGNPPFTQLNSSETNILFKNVRTPNQIWDMRTDFTGSAQFVATDIVFQDSVLGGIMNSPLPPGVIIQ